MNAKNPRKLPLALRQIYRPARLGWAGSYTFPALMLLMALVLSIACGAGQTPSAISPAAAKNPPPLPAPKAAPAAPEPPPAIASDSADIIVPGTAVLDPPTLVCLGVYWPYEGDANANASVSLVYRPKKGPTADWERALPLVRLHPENLPDDKHAPRDMPPAFAGSIFDLEPDTEYELKLNLVDPDGTSVESILNARTRAVPRAPDDMRTVKVNPGGLARAFKNAQPGDLLLLQPGIHKSPHYVSLKATAEKPLIVRGIDRDKVFIEAGPDDHVAIRADGSHHVWFEDLTFRNCGEGIRFHTTVGTVIRRCRAIRVYNGFRCIVPPARDAYIADNILTGPCGWPAAEGRIEGEEAIEVIGTGHVVCYNRIEGFGDAISIFRNPAVSIDFYGNEIITGTDDGIEMDYSDRNTRCFRNRITNARCAISLQPVFGGPVYVFRNEIFNTQYTPFKLHNGPTGGLLFHNTSVREGTPLIVWSGAPVKDMVFRNNIFIGTNDRLSNWTSPNINVSMDYDGYGKGKGLFKIANVWHKDIKAGARDAGLEPHGVLLDPPFFAGSIIIPAKNTQKMDPAAFDLHAESNAVDAGELLPNINENYQGQGPDLGAREYKGKPPHYGPRPAADQN